MSKSREIDVRKQRNLTLAETFHLCVKGITHRLLRSVLTLAVVVLAVAFFMFLLSENSFVASTAEGVGREILEQRFATTLMDRMFNVPSNPVLCRRLGNAWRLSPDSLAEYAAVARWDIARVRKLAETCDREQSYLKFFDRLSVGKSLVLVGKLKGRAILESLADPKEQAGFAERIEPMPDVAVPGQMAGFKTFLEEFPEYNKELQAFAGVWRTAIEDYTAECDKLTGGVQIDAWLCGASPEQLKTWGALAASRGFKLDSNGLTVVQKQLRMASLKQEIVHTLSTTGKQELWRKTFKDRKRISTEEKLLRLNNANVAVLLDNKYKIERLAEVSASVAHENSLVNLEHKLAGKVEATAEERNLSERQLFLLFISFIVCMVGIANAMLMSITERFREIATMKCLGATDRYILIQFMLEAALQGVAGGLLGMFLGFLIAMTKNAVILGTYMFANWPGLSLAANGLFSLAAGVLLAVLASVYPSWAASRMAPMEAMRIE